MLTQQEEQSARELYFKLRRWAIVLVLVIVAFTAGVLATLAVVNGGKSNSSGPAAGKQSPGTSTHSPQDNDDDAPLPESTPTAPEEQPEVETSNPPPEPDPKDVPAREDLTEGQAAALRSAKSTFDAVPIGRAHLIELTRVGGHALDDVVIAIAAMDIDWDDNAKAAAQSILKHTPSSESGLTEHLERIGFTPDQARQAVKSSDADWDEQAHILAKEFHDTFQFSRELLISQLEYEGFSSQQAEAAADELGL